MFFKRKRLIEKLHPRKPVRQIKSTPSPSDELGRLKDKYIEPLFKNFTELVNKSALSAPPISSASRTATAAAPYKADSASKLNSLKEFGQGVKTRLVASSNAMDQKWQFFITSQIDPLLGKTRNEQIKVLSTSERALEISEQEKALNRNLGISFAALAVGTVGTALYPPLMLLSASAVLWLAIPIWKSGYQSLTEKRMFRLEVNASLYMIGVLGFGYFVVGALGELIYYLSEKLILITYDRSSKNLTNIFGQQPRSVWVLKDGIEIEIPFEDLQMDDMIVIDAGQMVPVDGTIAQGIASIDQHMLTGEAQPVEKSLGDTVYASTIVLAGRVHVKVEKAGQETTAAQIGQILKQTASYQMSLESKGLQLAHQTAFPILLLSGLALPTVGAVGAVALLTGNFGINIKISSPIAMLNFLNIASHSGILVKDGRSLELLKEVDTVVFDKTGTLTLEQPHVAHIHLCPGYTEELLLTYAAAAERRQSHPIAQAILAMAMERQLSLPEIEHARYEIGYGIKVQIAEDVVRVGSDRYIAMEGIPIPSEIQDQQNACHTQGHSLVMVAVNEQFAGAIELQPTIRPEAKKMIAHLGQRNLDLYIISGDQAEPTRKLAQELGIEHYFANTLPEDKANIVEELQNNGKSVCFIGDGINDSIALKKANVSISLRGATTVATDTAQIILMDQSLNQLDDLFDLAQKFDTNMKTGFAAAIIPGSVVLGGVFLLHFGLYAAIAIHSVGLLSSLGVAMLPLLNNGRATPTKESN